jgi:hypothetical protein
MTHFAELLDWILPDVPTALLGAHSRRRLLASAERLPGPLGFGMFGFECDLTDPAPVVDLLVAVDGCQNGPALLQQAARSALPDDPSGAWTSLVALADLWAQPPWDQLLDDFWMEFDLQGPSPQTPNLFVGPRYDPSSRGSLPRILAAIIPHLLGDPQPTSHITCLHRCLARLPTHARVFQIGAMRARPSSSLRLCINDLSLLEIWRFLEDLHHPGDWRSLHSLGDRLCRVADAFAVQVELQPELSPYLGLECYLASRGQPDGVPKRRQALLLQGQPGPEPIPAKRQAIEDFIGITHLTPAERPCPQGLQRVGALLGATSAFRRSLHHVKFSFRPGEPCRTKAYLALQHQWIR